MTSNWGTGGAVPAASLASLRCCNVWEYLRGNTLSMTVWKTYTAIVSFRRRLHRHSAGISALLAFSEHRANQKASAPIARFTKKRLRWQAADQQTFAVGRHGMEQVACGDSRVNEVGDGARRVPEHGTLALPGEVWAEALRPAALIGPLAARDIVPAVAARDTDPNFKAGTFQKAGSTPVPTLRAHPHAGPGSSQVRGGRVLEQRPGRRSDQSDQGAYAGDVWPSGYRVATCPHASDLAVTMKQRMTQTCSAVTAGCSIARRRPERDAPCARWLRRSSGHRRPRRPWCLPPGPHAHALRPLETA